MSGDFDLHGEISRLVDRWCERRALSPLRIILGHWPPVSGLTDEYEDLLSSLRHLRAMCRDQLPPDEYEVVNKAVAYVNSVLHGDGR